MHMLIESDSNLSHLGLGIPGAGVAGSWKGFGFINYDKAVGLPRRSLCEETLSEVQSLADTLAGRVREYCATHTQDNATSGLWRSFMNIFHFTYDLF